MLVVGGWFWVGIQVECRGKAFAPIELDWSASHFCTPHPKSLSQSGRGTLNLSPSPVLGGGDEDKFTRDAPLDRTTDVWVANALASGKCGLGETPRPHFPRQRYNLLLITYYLSRKSPLQIAIMRQRDRLRKAAFLLCPLRAPSF